VIIFLSFFLPSHAEAPLHSRPPSFNVPESQSEFFLTLFKMANILFLCAFPSMSPKVTQISHLRISLKVCFSFKSFAIWTPNSQVFSFALMFLLLFSSLFQRKLIQYPHPFSLIPFSRLFSEVASFSFFVVPFGRNELLFCPSEFILFPFPFYPRHRQTPGLIFFIRNFRRPQPRSFPGILFGLSPSTMSNTQI